MPIRKPPFAVASLILLASALPAIARAAERRTIHVAAGPLDRAIAQLAAQAGIDIGSAEPGLARTVTRRLDGRWSGAEAIARLLRDTPYVARAIGPDSFRIVRRTPAPTPAPAPPAHPAPPPPVASPDIVVTAAKRDTAGAHFPGAVVLLRPDGPVRFGGDAGNSLDQAIAATPILQGTALGAGRNKLFIRGVADSSFTGPTQSTATVFLGEVPLAYNGADPGLNLFDIDRVEVLEGPQGTLYGAGAIGGIVRLDPHPVALDMPGATIAGGIALTRSGNPGGDVAAMVNLPLARGQLGVRAVGYRVVEGGYIDDVRRARRDVNATRTDGARIDLRADPAPGWSIDLGLVDQHVVADDLQYAERGLPPLSRAAALRQPFAQDYVLGHLTIDRRWDDGLHLVSATGASWRDAQARFDATRRTRPDVPIAYDTDERSRALTHETRLSRTAADGTGWLVGMAIIQARDVFSRQYGPPRRQRSVVGVRNRTLDTAIFGDASIAVTDRLIVSAGARLTRQRQDGEPIDDVRIGAYVRGRTQIRLDPSLGLSWSLVPGISAYARYQSGFRTGGVTVAPGVGRIGDLRPDTIRVAEIGVRKVRRGARGVSGTLGLSVADWRDIQADVVDRTGFPYTANIGDSRLVGLEASADWVPVAGLTLAGAVFVNDTRVDDAAVPAQPGRYQLLRSVRLPNTPPVAWSTSIAYGWDVGADATAAIDAGWRYVGRSTVGTRDPLDIVQGDYGVAQVAAHWSHGRVRIDATLENLLDGKGDRFAGGNPFALGARNEYTPLRPRTLRLAGRIAW